MAWDKAKKAAYNREYYLRNKEKWGVVGDVRRRSGPSTRPTSSHQTNALGAVLGAADQLSKRPAPGMKRIWGKDGGFKGYVDVNARLKPGTAAWKKAQGQALTEANKARVAAWRRNESNRMASDPYYRAKKEAENRRLNSIEAQKHKAAKIQRQQYAAARTKAAAQHELGLRKLKDRSYGSLYREGLDVLREQGKRVSAGAKKAARSYASNYREGVDMLKKQSKRAAKSFSSAWKDGVSQIKSNPKYKSAVSKGKSLINSVMKKFGR